MGRFGSHPAHLNGWRSNDDDGDDELKLAVAAACVYRAHAGAGHVGR